MVTSAPARVVTRPVPLAVDEEKVLTAVARAGSAIVSPFFRAVNIARSAAEVRLTGAAVAVRFRVGKVTSLGNGGPLIVEVLATSGTLAERIWVWLGRSSAILVSVALTVMIAGAVKVMLKSFWT